MLSPGYQLLISCAGSLYIAYLAHKIARAGLATTAAGPDALQETAEGELSFQSGVIMQLLNPKAFVAILPIATVQFPAAHITGGSILLWSLLLACLALGAPGSYLLMGARLGNLISRPGYFKMLNLIMASLLLYVAGDIAYGHVYLQWP